MLMRFSLGTGTRPGTLNNATMEEYRRGKMKDQCKVMLVAKHKRGKDRPAITPIKITMYVTFVTRFLLCFAYITITY